MSSRSGSDSESNRSGSPIIDGPVPTPGHGLNRSASNSPEYTNRSPRPGSRSSRSRSRTPSSTRSRSGSAASNKSANSQKSGGSNRSRKSRSRSVASNRSKGSGSHRSGSGNSHKSGSNRSGSRSRSRSSSAGSKKSKSRSRSRSRSGSAASNRSGSRSRSPSNRSRSRSGSAASNRSKSRSKSVESNKSRRSGSRSRSPSKERRDRSKSASPSLQIAEAGGSPKSENRKRDSSEEKTTKKKSRVLDSDSDGEEAEAAKGVSAAAIFGDADDISSEDEKDDKNESERDTRRSDDDDRRSDDDNRDERPEHDEEEKENEPEPIPETRIDVEIPKISCDLGKDIHFVKLPNFLSVETRPFDPETYEDEIDEEETLDEEGRARLKLKVENTIRWKDVIDKEGNIKKESNARLVKWSDGSYSLHLGSEIFDVYKQPLQGDHNHLFIRQGTGLQGQAVFRTKLSFRPHSTESFTHRKMTLSLADRSQKTSGIKILSQVGADPDHDRKFLLKKEEEKLRQTVRVSKPRRKGDSSARSHNTLYREEDGSEDEGAISLNAIKNKYKSGAATASKGGAIYSSDEEGSDIEARRARKLDKAKVLKDSDTSEDSE